MKTHHVKETIVRSEDEGPTPDIECAEDGTAATATWLVPAGQLLDDSEAPEELDTGGYVYFTLDSAPTDVIKGVEGGETADFSGANIDGPTPVSITTEVEPGVDYRAHLLLAYDDGTMVHDDTVFVCEAPVAEATTTTVAQPTTTDTPDTLPLTGAAGTDLLLPLAIVLTGLGATILAVTHRLFGGSE